MNIIQVFLPFLPWTSKIPRKLLSEGGNKGVFHCVNELTSWKPKGEAQVMRGLQLWVQPWPGVGWASLTRGQGFHHSSWTEASIKAQSVGSRELAGLRTRGDLGSTEAPHPVLSALRAAPFIMTWAAASETFLYVPWTSLAKELNPEKRLREPPICSQPQAVWRVSQVRWGAQGVQGPSPSPEGPAPPPRTRCQDWAGR